MTDADTDGAHIQVLLLTFFFKYMKPLVQAGRVFIALPPLYKLEKGKGKSKQVEYAWTDDELEKLQKKLGKGFMLQRYKGLGEMNPEQLWETTMNPETRTLIRVQIEDEMRSSKRVTTLMGDKVAPRREWIESHVEFGMQEDQSILDNTEVQVLETEEYTEENKLSEIIQDLSLEDVIGDRFGRYSKYIIQERALPDVRDGLKPVQRRILFAMHSSGNTYDKNFRKSAKTVGDVIGQYHPHGDLSVYDAMVRLSQDWKLRHVLIEMHGNNGSIDNDPPAAMRYTEAKLSQLSEELVRDINKETVAFVPNYDDTTLEPMVLPARFPNLLVNGSTGISSGYATDIPPHNLAEVIQATLKYIDNPDITVTQLMKYIKGPDFPTGGIIQGVDGIKKAYETGKGKIVVRSKVDEETLRNGRQQLIVTEIPYEVNKSSLVKRIDELRADKK